MTDSMVAALDIETIANMDEVFNLPPVKVSKTLKDPEKIEAAKAKAKKDQVDKMALEPLTARIVSYAVVGRPRTAQEDTTEAAYTITEATDESEKALIIGLLKQIGVHGFRIVTWNGIGFDMPMIYKRALLLGINPAELGAPPLSEWTKKYTTERHYDLMQIWACWNNSYSKLDYIASVVLGEKKVECDFTKFAEMINTEEGRKELEEYCLQDTRLTWKLYERFSGVLFN